MLSPEYVKFALNNSFKHKLLVSATLSGEKRAMALKIAPLLYEKKTFEIEGDGIINKSRHLLVKYLLNDEENRQYIKYNDKFIRLLNDDTLWAQNQLKFLSIERKQFLQNLTSSRSMCRNLISYLHKNVQNTRVLIFGGSVAQIDSIMPWTYHSENEKSDWLNAFNNGDINYLGVVGKIDRGVNLNNINTIIFESIDASETKMIQRSGRGKRMKQDEVLDVYYLIPYFKTEKGDIKPTVVEKWFTKSTTNIDTSNLENFVIPCPTPNPSM
jgi:superfamily II DNA or RNA helicase